jgi:hypothetical protein
MITTGLLATLLATPVVLAQSVEFTEVLVIPAGNSTIQIIEVKNFGDAMNFSGWQLVTPTSTTPLPAISVPADQITLLHLGQSGFSTSSDIYLPTVPGLTPAGSLALFSSPQTNHYADLVDYVSWGGGFHAIGLAVQAGQWPSTAATAPSPLVPGTTIAHYDEVAYGNRNRPESWFLDSTPTLGANNDGAGLFAGAYGCPQLTNAPQLGHGGESNRPWIGEPWPLYTYNMPPTPSSLLLALGTSNSGALPLDYIGIPGCFWDVTADAVVGFAAPASYGPLPLAIPNQANLVGSVFFLQAMVAYPGANPANLLVTRVIHAYVGSR